MFLGRWRYRQLHTLDLLSKSVCPSVLSAAEWGDKIHFADKEVI